MPNVVIVGGGISGLSLAYRLQLLTRNCQVIVLERDSRLGGTIGTERRDGFLVEIGPNGFLDNKSSTLNLSNEIGLTDQLVRASEVASRNRFVFMDGKLRALPTSFGSFLRSGVLSWRGKLSILVERFRSAKREESDETIADFFRRRIGREATEKLADAFVTGIYAGDPEVLSLRASFPRLAEMEGQYGSLVKGMAAAARQRRKEAAAAGRPSPRGNAMWSFHGGVGMLIERLRERLNCPPIVGVRVHRIEQNTERDAEGRLRWSVKAEGRDGWTADAVVLVCPAYEQATILGDVDNEIAEQIRGIPYAPVAVVAMGYRRSDVPGLIDGFGYLVPHREQRDVLGVQWCSSIFTDRAPEDTVLFRVMCGGWRRRDILDWEDERLLKTIECELRLAMNIQAKPIFHHVIRWHRAIPQYLCGHLDLIRTIDERVSKYPGLFLGGNCYRGVSLNDCVERSYELARRIARYLAGKDSSSN